MVTGDHPATVLMVAQQVHLAGGARAIVVTGAELAALSLPDGDHDRLLRAAGCARVSPAQKLDLIGLALALRATDRDAALAIDMFCHHARKAVGALTATKGGIDTLVFTGGIGARLIGADRT